MNKSCHHLSVEHRGLCLDTAMEPGCREVLASLVGSLSWPYVYNWTHLTVNWHIYILKHLPKILWRIVKEIDIQKHTFPFASWTFLSLIFINPSTVRLGREEKIQSKITPQSRRTVPPPISSIHPNSCCRCTCPVDSLTGSVRIVPLGDS